MNLDIFLNEGRDELVLFSLVQDQHQNKMLITRLGVETGRVKSQIVKPIRYGIYREKVMELEKNQYLLRSQRQD